MSLWEGSHVNPSASQENKKVQTMTAISGQKCLDSLGRSNPNSLLGRMCKELLTSKTAWYSDRCKTSWKVKVSKSNVSLFQLQASVLGTKDIESGLWATPNTMDYLPPRSAAGTKKIMEGHRKGRTKPSNLREQVDPETMRMYPTPTQDSASERTKKYKQGGLPLTMAVQMLPTPTTSEHKYRLKGNTQASKCLEARARKAGGKLSANFTEFLMGYNMDWTKIEPTELKLLETQSYHKSQQKSVKQLKVYGQILGF